jgi:hypothetical protein
VGILGQGAGFHPQFVKQVYYHGPGWFR